MPRWRALPEELDPRVREFASQLRTLVERSGLSVATVADRTGYSKTSWERYLNGRLLPPQRAVVALAEVTGADTGHLTTMWELAERAWSRSEARHDITMEATRVAQARAALGEFGPPPAKAKGRRRERVGKDDKNDKNDKGGHASREGKGDRRDKGGVGQGRSADRYGGEPPSRTDFPGMAAPPPAATPPARAPAPPTPSPPRPRPRLLPPHRPRPPPRPHPPRRRCGGRRPCRPRPRPGP
ncbi:helix-turn-helix transcriptional regulator [Streptomyces sp. MST-110588]|uniref:helix-turn-helix domain-containing protein n=1 Tax=Streptomyces sp. MST-110588 TaxID=2833628 RepID=UPI001F5DBD2C|nr:helix-turn-helix transcriptional regulator [Streptomyces sp. MST-110588]